MLTGTKVILKLKNNAKEYLEHIRLSSIIKKYSDHIKLSSISFNEDEKKLKKKK